MPFTALCPHCRICRLRAPRAKRGKDVRCPKCREVFQLLPQDDEKQSDPQSNLHEGKTRSSTSSLPLAKQNPTTTEGQPDELVALAQIALGLAVIVLLLSQLPYGRPAAVLIAVLGFCASGFTLLELKKQLALLGWGGLVLNGLLTVILVGYPATLGLTGWWSESNQKPADNAENQLGDWIDAGDAAWQQNGVRVSVTFATIGEEPSANSGSGSKQRYLWIGLRVTNVGLAELEFSGWRGKGAEGPEISTPDGTLLAIKQYEGPSGKSTIQPGKYLQCMIASEIPPPGQDLHLSLPTQPFGDRVIIRFRIPHGLVGRQ